MAKISEEDARKILTENGYNVLELLGIGAASIVFKATKKGEDCPLAVKLCRPQGSATADLESEIKSSEELQKLEKKFEDQIIEATKQGQTKLVEMYKKAKKHLFKYLTVPKLIKVKKDETPWYAKRSDYDWAIFEAPLADTSMDDYKIGNGMIVRAEGTTIPDPEYKVSTTVLKVEINYKELKRAIRSILKGFKVIHDQGKVHGDVFSRNVLKKLYTKNKVEKYRYSVTDFGTLSDSTHEAMSEERRNLGILFLGFWYGCLGFDINKLMSAGVVSIATYENYEQEDFMRFSARDAGKRLLYALTKDDKQFMRFGKKLVSGDYKDAGEALEDPWLKKQ